MWKGRFLHYSLLGMVNNARNVSQTFEELEAKRSAMVHHVKVTHPLSKHTVVYCVAQENTTCANGVTILTETTNS